MTLLLLWFMLIFIKDILIHCYDFYLLLCFWFVIHGPFLILHPFALIITSLLPGRLCTRSLCVVVWICPFSRKSISEVRHWCQMRRCGAQWSFQFIPKVFCAVEVRALCRSLEFFQFIPWQIISSWTSLCEQGLCHAGTGLGHLVSVKKILMLQHTETFSATVY